MPLPSREQLELNLEAQIKRVDEWYGEMLLLFHLPEPEAMVAAILLWPTFTPHHTRSTILSPTVMNSAPLRQPF